MPETDDDCLDYYYRKWEEFRMSSSFLNKICKYLNEQRHKRDASMRTMEQTALHIWREHLFKDLNVKISNAALQMLDRNREGESINSSAIQAVVQSYIELGTLEVDIEFENDAYLKVRFSTIRKFQ